MINLPEEKVKEFEVKRAYHPNSPFRGRPLLKI
jgi:hypothetical protein